MTSTREAYLKIAYAGPILKTRWINDVFNTYLNQPQGETNVAALAVGGCEELPHLRFFTGHGANIHAFDILQPSMRMRDLSEYAKVQYHREGIQRIDKVIRHLGGEPNLVICRAPRILETVSKHGFKFNTWWADTLAGYGERVRGIGQMLVTTYTGEERDIVAEALDKRAISFSTYENDLCPINVPNYTGPNGPIRAGIDKYVLVSR